MSVTTETEFKVPYWTKGDLNAFFGLGFNILVNVLVLTGLCIGVVNIAPDDVYGKILPALGIALIVGNLYYTYLARRLAAKERRLNVTAMPYGPSVPHMFIVVFVIMLPVYLQTKNPLMAWQAGIAWAFVIGVIVLLGAFVGPTIRKYTPRAAMLGALAGISLTFISMRPAAQMWDALWIALPVLLIILIGFMSGVKLPGGIPIGLAALLVGTAIGWAGGFMDAPAVGDAAKNISLAFPTADFGRLIDGLKEVSPLLATAIPLGIYNFTEAMTNVESAAAAGDSYNLRAVLLADGAGAVIGSALGSPFPPAVYIGHPGWKDAGGRSGYSLASGVVVALMCFLGLFGLLAALLPTPAIVPILLYIGLMIGAQAFQAVPRVYAAAVVAATIPSIAQWATGQMDNALAAAGTTADQVGATALANAGLVYGGMKTLGEGAILAGLVFGAIVFFVIDRKMIPAAAFCVFGAALSWIGLIHGEKIEWGANGQATLGYLFGAATCLVFLALKIQPRDTSGDEVLDEEGNLITVPVEAEEATPPAVLETTTDVSDKPADPAKEPA